MGKEINNFIRPELIIRFKNKCCDAGIDVIITSVDRSLKEQMALYAQGRCDYEYVNQLRRMAGLNIITYEGNKVVTWTIASKHIIDAQNPKSRAFDFCIINKGSAVWDIKADINLDSIPDYKTCALIGEGLGLRSGMRFPNPDYPHLEIA